MLSSVASLIVTPTIFLSTTLTLPMFLTSSHLSLNGNSRARLRLILPAPGESFGRTTPSSPRSLQVLRTTWRLTHLTTGQMSPCLQGRKDLPLIWTLRRLIPHSPFHYGASKFRRYALLFTLLNHDPQGIASNDLVSLGLPSFSCLQRPFVLFLLCSPALAI